MAKIEIDSELIRELAQLLEETGLTEIEVGDGDRRIRVARGLTGVVASAVLPALAAAGTAAAAAVPASSAAARPAKAEAGHPGAVTSPMVGTVYLSPEPGAPPFVQVGDTVRDGQTLFIIEAMKVMNPIRAPRGGRVAQILVEGGAPVEYGEVLLILE